MNNSIITLTDSYKLNHWNQYPEGTEHVYSYFESRNGAKFDNTVFFGLQYLLKEYLAGEVVTQPKIERAAKLAKAHFGREGLFNRAGWEYIRKEYDGRLPILIKAVPEGTPVPVSNVLMTVENLDPKCGFLTNHLESLLTHVWHASNVATLSRETKKMIKFYRELTSDSNVGLEFMLHDFGFRGVSSVESAGVGGAGHLVNFLGTDTLKAMEVIVDYYNGNPNFEGIAYSVPATEHSIMTSMGREGELKVVERLLNEYPTGILSVVADSYDYYYFVNSIVGYQFRKRILERDGVFVVRPDSVTPSHPTPEDLMAWTLETLHFHFGAEKNNKGFYVLNPKVRVLWGDGIDKDGINKILDRAKVEGYSAENLVFGMGGGLLQKHNRDTQRNAFKSSAQRRNGVWRDIQKDPVDKSKVSKKGRLKLTRVEGGHGSIWKTVGEAEEGKEYLVPVFETGEILRDYNFDEIRKNAEIVDYPGAV
jgi:nicotinamide phosphoribosyltransferase